MLFFFLRLYLSWSKFLSFFILFSPDIDTKTTLKSLLVLHVEVSSYRRACYAFDISPLTDSENFRFYNFHYTHYAYDLYR